MDKFKIIKIISITAFILTVNNLTAYQFTADIKCENYNYYTGNTDKISIALDNSGRDRIADIYVICLDKTGVFYHYRVVGGALTPGFYLPFGNKLLETVKEIFIPEGYPLEQISNST